MLEEQDNQARWQQQAYGPHRRNSRPHEQGYDSPASPPGQGAPGQGKDTMAEIQEGLTKAAEGRLHRSHRPFYWDYNKITTLISFIVGKKTIGGLFTRVKAKIQEFEQGRSNTNANQSQSQWAGGYDPQQHQTYPQQAPYAQYHHGSAGAASPPQASYYDPNVPSPVISEQTSSPPSRIPAPAVQGYDASPTSSTSCLLGLSQSKLSAESPSVAPATAPTPPPATSSSAGASSVPPPASNAAPIDGGMSDDLRPKASKANVRPI